MLFFLKMLHENLLITTGYTSLVINTGTTDNATSFYGYAFSKMGSVTNVEIVNGGNNKIPDNTFKGAEFKAGVDLNIDKDKAITTIGAYAFSGANFPKNLDLSQFTSIGSHAFEGNTTLANDGVTFADNTTIGEAAFLGCTSLSGTLTIPKGASVAYQAFNNCSGITSIVLHSGMTSGEHDRNGCFMSMSGVSSVSIIKDDDYNTIPANVFGGASFSKDVTLKIDKDITGIGAYAFNNAYFPTTLDLSKFTSYGASAFENNKAFQGNDQKVIAVKPSGENSVTVGSRAFWNTQATEVDVDPNVTYSGCENYGPYNGSNIKNIIFNSAITDIPDYVFNNATDILADCSVAWPTNTIRNIGEKAFYGVKFAAALPKAMTGTIGEYAYAYNGMSGAITIPTGCIEIGSHAL